MSGNRYLFDTNAIIQLLKGNPELDHLAANADFLVSNVAQENSHCEGLKSLSRIGV